ncbi:MAG: acetolactate decarboxylase [Neisseriaceae bacterium]|jgi:acetolactate decarboxylase
MSGIKANEYLKLKNLLSFDLLSQQLNSYLKNMNLLYAIQIDADFNCIKLRILRPQKKPYPLLEQVWAGQAIHLLHNVKGTMVGFFFPIHMQCLNMINYHFHFITHDYQWGGHVLDVDIKAASVAAQRVQQFNLYLPNTASFSEFQFENTIPNS